MNRILFESKQSDYQLNPMDSRFEHVRGILRMGIGDTFDVGVVNGPAGKARILDLSEQSMRVAVDWHEVPPKPPAIHLLVGMCRPATARKILLTVPTLGVREITFAGCGRSDPAYAKSSLWTTDEWRQRLIEGAEQAFDTHVPDLHLHTGIEQAASEAAKGATQCLALDVYEGTRPLSGIPFSGSDSVCLAVGPERGWNVNDRKALTGAGFTLVSLNDRVLRVETAVTVGLALVLAGLGIY